MTSILIPLYNGIEFIEQSITSVLNQSFTDWELIIGVNGHAPNSDVYMTAKKYEVHPIHGCKIRVLDLHEMIGKANTLNEMLKYCIYDYVAILDVDDIWLPEKLEIQMTYIECGFDVVGSQCVYFGDMEGVIPAIPLGDISTADFRAVNPIINSSSVIRKSLCHWVHKWNGVEDYDMWLRLRYKHQEGVKIFNCMDVLVKHRIHRKSAFNSSGNHLKVSDLLAQYA